jgi:hypothetical protein
MYQQPLQRAIFKLTSLDQNRSSIEERVAARRATANPREAICKELLDRAQMALEHSRQARERFERVRARISQTATSDNLDN